VDTLFTPWRYAYIAQQPAPGEECFFCAAARAPEAPDSLVVHLGVHHLVMLNRHPYTNGHVMIAPLAHVASPRDGDAAAQAEFWPLVLATQRVLEQAYRPDGFNFGMNLGRMAGAGVPAHHHFHLVPRWQGDTNFMSVVGGVRLVPEELPACRDRLRRLFTRLEE
jgi:ATP adenylyltransferase